MTVQTISTVLSADQELARQIAASLNSHHVQSLRSVKVQITEGVIVLRGEVGTFYAKQLAQHCAARLAVNNRLVDEVTVRPQSSFRDPRRLRQSASAGVALIVLAIVAGCSKSQELPRVEVHPVTGQVIYQGKPASGVWVVFHPKGSGGFPAKARVDSQGNFKLSTYAPNDGAPAGEYAVTLELLKAERSGSETETGANVFPPKYASPTATVLTARVIAGSNTVPIKITR